MGASKGTYSGGTVLSRYYLEGETDEGSSRKWRKWEDAALAAAGFEALEDEQDLWRKGDTLYGREAALQKARRALAEIVRDEMFERRAS